MQRVFKVRKIFDQMLQFSNNIENCTQRASDQEKIAPNRACGDREHKMTQEL